MNVKTDTEMGAVQNGILDLGPETPQIPSDTAVKEADVTPGNTATSVPDTGEVLQITNEEFASLLNISLGDKRRTILCLLT